MTYTERPDWFDEGKARTRLADLKTRQRAHVALAEEYDDKADEEHRAADGFDEQIKAIEQVLALPAKEASMDEFTTYAHHGDPDYNSRTAAGCEASGEPVFTLRAQDRFAANTVRIWAGWVLADNPDMAAEARRIADAMDAWPVHKVPD